MNDYKAENGKRIMLTDDEQAAHNSRIVSYNAVLPSRLLAALADHRYNVQNGGTTVSGNIFKTDAESRLALLAVYSVASADSSFSCIWKTATGSFVTLTSVQIIAAGNAVLEFVQKCFDIESGLAANIANYSTAGSIISDFDEGMTS